METLDAVGGSGTALGDVDDHLIGRHVPRGTPGSASVCVESTRRIVQVIGLDELIEGWHLTGGPSGHRHRALGDRRWIVLEPKDARSPTPATIAVTTAATSDNPPAVRHKGRSANACSDRPAEACDRPPSSAPALCPLRPRIAEACKTPPGGDGPEATNRPPLRGATGGWVGRIDSRARTMHVANGSPEASAFVDCAIRSRGTVWRADRRFTYGTILDARKERA